MSGQKIRFFSLIIVLSFFLTPSAHASSLINIDLDNGISATIYPAEYISEKMIEIVGDVPVLRVYGTFGYELINNLDDPAIINSGDGEFHPMERSDVIEALEDINLNGLRMDIDLEIYILPLPRRYYLRSTAVGNRIYLSPGVYNISDESAAFTVTHEFGHCYANRYLPGPEEDRWDIYLEARGLDGDYRFSTTAIHSYRPTEIFAEDFRYLFGGRESNYSGTIENPEIPLPDEVAGLEIFFVNLATEKFASGEHPIYDGNKIINGVSNYPNPFNPSTSIKIEFDTEQMAGIAEVKVFSVDGSLVKDLYSGFVNKNELIINWDGKDRQGRNVKSGVYFCRVNCRGETAVKKMALIR